MQQQFIRGLGAVPTARNGLEVAGPFLEQRYIAMAAMARKNHAAGDGQRAGSCAATEAATAHEHVQSTPDNRTC